MARRQKIVNLVIVSEFGPPLRHGEPLEAIGRTEL
jgi:hypothetical protein